MEENNIKEFPTKEEFLKSVQAMLHDLSHGKLQDAFLIYKSEGQSRLWTAHQSTEVNNIFGLLSYLTRAVYIINKLLDDMEDKFYELKE